MSAWQSMMIRLARSGPLKSSLQGNPLTKRLAGRFVGGADEAQAVARALELQRQGMLASLYYLGEYVDSKTLVQENVTRLANVIERLGTSGLDVHVSVDPTQIGYALSERMGQENALRLGRLVARQPGPGRRLLMLDMEDCSITQATLDLRARLAQDGIPAAITIQAYLYRSEDDLRDLIRDGVAVRLVKGAFAEPKERAWTSKADVDRAYARLAELLLSADARERGVYPIFATHDDRMIDAIQALAARCGWPTNGYEFEMLYGERPPLQRQLVSRGFTLRLYLPFGTEWWPYTARRIGENPANAVKIWKTLWSRA